jgi:hypothetical protein
MSDEGLRYDQWIEEALRRVIFRALKLTEAEGLRGDHHFYITFRTGAAGVEVPPYLRAQHPDEMTIVLQHQFESLIVGDDMFSVVLRFNGKPEQLQVPFEAVTSFADPSVNFGLQLKTVELDDDDFETLSIDPVNSIEDLGPIDSKTSDAKAEPADPDGAEKPKTGEVIALDAFRKK